MEEILNLRPHFVSFHRPRAYQSEILQVCQKRNAIIRLDTGMGKTFIAASLLLPLVSLHATQKV